MDKFIKLKVNSLCNSVIMVAEKFIHKVDIGKAKSVETYTDLNKLKLEAKLLKNLLNRADAYIVECCNPDCDWSGFSTDCSFQPHTPNELLCPLCYEVVEPVEN